MNIKIPKIVRFSAPFLNPDFSQGALCQILTSTLQIANIFLQDLGKNKQNTF